MSSFNLTTLPELAWHQLSRVMVRFSTSAIRVAVDLVTSFPPVVFLKPFVSKITAFFRSLFVDGLAGVPNLMWRKVSDFANLTIGAVGTLLKNLTGQLIGSLQVRRFVEHVGFRLT